MATTSGARKTSPKVGWLFVAVGFVPVLVLNWFEELQRLVPTNWATLAAR